MNTKKPKPIRYVAIFSDPSSATADFVTIDCPGEGKAREKCLLIAGERRLVDLFPVEDLAVLAKAFAQSDPDYFIE